LARLLNYIFGRPDHERDAILVVAAEKIDGETARRMLKTVYQSDDRGWGS
jgi:hypothetical protein